MPRFHVRLRPALMGLVMIVVAGCDDSATTVITTGQFVTLGPSSIRSSSPTFVSPPAFVSRLESPTVRAERIATGFCPAQPPFLAPISLLFQAGTADVSFTGIQLQFADRLGGREPLRTLSQIDLFDRFGTTLVPAFGRRTFEFGFPFGCAGASTGTLVIVVSATDSLNRESRATLQLDVQ